MPLTDSFYGENCNSQQDNVLVHRSIKTTEFLANNGFEVMLWQAKWIDLNIIENVYGRPARDVYKERI